MEERCKPPIDLARVPQLVKQLFEFTTIEVQELCGYEDSNFFVRVKEHDDPFVLKVSNSADSAIPDLIEELNRLMAFCAERGLRVPQPYVRPDGLSVIRQALSQKDIRDQPDLINSPDAASRNTIISTEKVYAIRLVHFLPGKLLKFVEFDQKLLFDVGKRLASLHSITQDFDSSVLRNRNCIWSLENVPPLTSHLTAIADADNRDIAAHVITEFATTVVPVIGDLESIQVHGDPNEANILVHELPDGPEISGFIDFGDSHYAPRIFDLAYASLYMMMEADSKQMDMLVAAESVITGYSRIHPLTQLEMEILPICMKGRLVQSLILGAQAFQQQPANDYLLTTAVNGWKLLRFMNEPSFKLSMK